MNLRPNKNPTAVDTAVDAAYAKLAEMDPTSDEFVKATNNIQALLKTTKPVRDRVSPDTIVKVAGSIVSVLIIIAYEQKHVISKTAVGFVVKP